MARRALERGDQLADEGVGVVKLPSRRFSSGTYRIITDSAGGVDVFGNRDGLLYLAEVIVRCALGNHSDGFHVHLPNAGVSQQPDVSGEPELTIYSAATEYELGAD